MSIVNENDYSALCTALREEAECCKAIEWDIPICTEDHIRLAADVIEKLTAKCKKLEEYKWKYEELCR